MAYSERELLARLIQCEAGGEGESGMRAVATVVMNRLNVNSGEFARVGKGGDVRSIIQQPGQFVCLREVLDGEYNNQNVYNMIPEPIHYEIADWALNGGRLGGIGDSLFFFNPYSEECPAYFPTNIGKFYAKVNHHCFYSPTENYYNT